MPENCSVSCCAKLVTINTFTFRKVGPRTGPWWSVSETTLRFAKILSSKLLRRVRKSLLKSLNLKRGNQTYFCDVHKLAELALASAEIYYDLMAANSLDEVEHVLRSNSFYDEPGILSLKAIQEVFGEYALVFLKDGNFNDIHHNLMKLAIAEPWLFRRIHDIEAHHRPFLSAQAKSSARAKAKQERTQQADMAIGSLNSALIQARLLVHRPEATTRIDSFEFHEPDLSEEWNTQRETAACLARSAILPRDHPERIARKLAGEPVLDFSR